MIRGVFLLAIVLSLAACPAPDRTDAFAGEAESLGMVFHTDLPEGVGRAMRAMPGISFRPQSAFPRVLAHDRAMIFDWTWQDPQAPNLGVVSQTVFATRYEGARLPGFLISETRDASEAEIAAAGGALRFTTPNQWIDRYVIAGRSKSSLRKLFPVELRSSWELPPKLRIEANGEWVIAYYPGRLSDPNTLEWEFRDVQTVLAPWVAR